MYCTKCGYAMDSSYIDTKKHARTTGLKLYIRIDICPNYNKLFFWQHDKVKVKNYFYKSDTAKEGYVSLNYGLEKK